jgi:dTDP-glucose pyrophosphorylase
MSLEKHIVSQHTSIREALEILDSLAQDAILFVCNEKKELLGSITDGDIRRGLISKYDLKDFVHLVCKKNPSFIRKNQYSVKKIIEFRKKNLRIIPILNDDSDEIIDVLNFRLQQTLLPIEAVIMAGGEGIRLRPLTIDTPKALLKVGDKPIIEHNLDAFKFFGIQKVWLTTNYLADQLMRFAIEKSTSDFQIKTVIESFPLGTIGALKLIPEFDKEVILVSNCDILTDVNFESFYIDFIESDADFSIISIPYNVDVPYALLDTNNGYVINLEEKPTKTYYANGGIYLMKKSMLEFIPDNKIFSAIELIENLLNQGKKIRSYSHYGYWLDIGRHSDFNKAQDDIKKITSHE